MLAGVVLAAFGQRAVDLLNRQTSSGAIVQQVVAQIVSTVSDQDLSRDLSINLYARYK